MPGITIFETMTDEQLALWHQQDATIQQLTRDLAEARTETEAVRAGSEIRMSQTKALLERRAMEVFRAEQKVKEHVVTTRRLCGQQVQTLKALRRLVAAIDQCDRCGWAVGARDVLTKIIAEANEVIALLDVPFG